MGFAKPAGTRFRRELTSAPVAGMFPALSAGAVQPFCAGRFESV